MKNYISIVPRFLKKQYKKSLLTILGIVLSICMITSIGIISSSIKETQIKQAIELSGDYHVSYSNLSEEKLLILKNHFNIENIGVSLPLGTHKVPDTSISVSIEAWDENAMEMMGMSLKSGSYPKEKHEIALEEWLVDELGLNIEEKITLSFSQTYEDENDKLKTYEGKNDFIISGILTPAISGGKAWGSSLSLISLDTVKSIMPKEVYSSLSLAFVTLKEGLNIKESSKEILGNINMDEENMDFNSMLMNALGENDKINGPIVFLGLSIVIATMLTIYNIFHISVVERTQYFGMLRAIGSTPKQIRLIVLCEGLVLSLISIPIGIILGILLSKIFITSLPILQNVIKEVTISLNIILFSSLIAIISIFLSLLGPSYFASKISPLEAIRKSSTKKEFIKKSTLLNKFFQRLFHIRGKIAYQNMWRNKKRTLVTITSMCLSGALFIVFSYYIKNLDISNVATNIIDSDYTIKTTNISKERSKSYDDEDISYIQGLPGVEKVFATQAYYATSSYPEEKLSPNYKESLEKRNVKPDSDTKEYNLDSLVYAYDDYILNNSKKFLLSGAIDIEKMSNNNEILLIDPEGKLNIDVGETITYKFSYYTEDKLDEVKELKFKVGGVLKNTPNSIGFSNIAPSIILHKDVYKNSIGLSGYKMIDIKLSQDSDIEFIEKELNHVAKKVSEGTLFSFEEEVKKLKTLINQIIMLSLCLLAVIIVIGVLNITNTISTNLIVRTREFATFRALGTTNEDLRNIIKLEGAFYGIISGVLGSILGILLSYVLFIIMKNELTYLEWYVPWLSVIINLIANVCLGISATLLPLKRISSMNIIDSIRTID
ncbi:MAG: FtsX-like permease family protein [Clostridiaceae bacterium]